MAVLPTNKRDQIMLGVVVLAFGLIYVFYEYYHSPKTVTLDALEERVESLTANNETVRQEVVRGTAETLKRDADMYGRMLIQMRALVPVSNEVPTLLEQISNAARQTGLELGGITPLGILPGEVFDTHRFRMGVTGPYHRIGQFLDNVGSLTRIMAPMNLTLRPAARPGRPLAGQQHLDAGFEIQTYVLKVTPPARTAAPTSGGQ
jgi:type IV pilus assembly protein PilO